MASENVHNLRKFVVPEMVFGVGGISLTGRYARNLGAKKVLVVSDDGVIKAGWTQKVINSIEEEGIPFVVFSNITPNPRAEEVMQGAEIYRRENCNMIVTVGGGSPMDCAKGIGVVHSNGGNILDYNGVDKISQPIPPLLCIPTTAGSSADVSQFAIITDTHNRVKIAIVSKMIVPDVALIDPETTTTMDPYLTACTGLDALTHAVEAYLSNASSPITDLTALEAIRLVSYHLEKVIKNPMDTEERSAMMLGSMYAGMAFSNASLGAVHAMAHSLGGFLDLAHGECNSLLLEHVVEFNFGSVPQKCMKIAQSMGLNIEGETPEKQKYILTEGIARLRKSVGIDKKLSDMGVRRDDIPRLSKFALKDACMVTNPIHPTSSDVEAIYEKVF